MEQDALRDPPKESSAPAGCGGEDSATNERAVGLGHQLNVPSQVGKHPGELVLGVTEDPELDPLAAFVLGDLGDEFKALPRPFVGVDPDLNHRAGQDKLVL